MSNQSHKILWAASSDDQEVESLIAVPVSKFSHCHSDRGELYWSCNTPLTSSTTTTKFPPWASKNGSTSSKILERFTYLYTLENQVKFLALEASTPLDRSQPQNLRKKLSQRWMEWCQLVYIASSIYVLLALMDQAPEVYTGYSNKRTFGSSWMSTTSSTGNKKWKKTMWHLSITFYWKLLPSTLSRIWWFEL